MDAHKQLTIGLFGFGVVGEGLYKVLQQTPSLKATLKKSVSRTRLNNGMHRLLVYH
jgi:homoserine dehydrogenase